MAYFDLSGDVLGLGKYTITINGMAASAENLCQSPNA
jgi:hypothetical protein